MISFFLSLNSMIRIRRTPLCLALLVALSLSVIAVVRTRQAFGRDQDVQKLNALCKHREQSGDESSSRRSRSD